MSPSLDLELRRGNNSVSVVSTSVGMKTTDIQWKQCAEGNGIKVSCGEALV